MKSNEKGVISLVTSAAIYGSFGVLIKLMGEELSVNNQIIFRYAIAAFLMLITIVITKSRMIFKSNGLLLLIFLFIMHISIWAFTQGAMITSITSLLGTFYIGSITTSTLVGSLVLREKISIKQWLITLTLIAALYSLASKGGSSAGLMWGFISGSLENITQIMRGKLKGFSKGLLTLSVLIGVLIITTVQVIVAGEKIAFPQEVKTWVAGVIFGALVIIVNLATTYGFRILPASLGSLIMSSEIAFGSIFGLLFLGVKPELKECILSVVVLAAVAIQHMKIKEDNRVVSEIRNILES